MLSQETRRSGRRASSPTDDAGFARVRPERTARLSPTERRASLYPQLFTTLWITSAMPPEAARVSPSEAFPPIILPNHTGETPMKINVEVDCTPEEARRAMGLPDFTPVHERYVAMLTETMEKGASPELLDQMMKSWAPMGEAGMTFWRKMFETAGRGG